MLDLTSTYKTGQVEALEPRIVQRDDLLLIGLEYYGPLQGNGWSEENSIGHLWTRWKRFTDEYGHLIDGKTVNPNISYEVAAWNDEEYENTSKYYIFVGAEIKSVEEALPLQLVARRLPGGACAEFTIKGNEIQKWETLFYNEWLPETGYRCAKFDGYSYQVQAYENGRFKGISQNEIINSEIDVIVPLDRMV